MSTAALTVQPRHLALPDSCLFAPTELAIPTQISQNEYQKLGAGLSKLTDASGLWLADFVAFGDRWENGLALASAATGRSRHHLKRCGQVAVRFPAAKRFPAYTIAHYRHMMPFPAEFTDTFLSKVARLNLSVKALRIRAEAEYGSNPYGVKNPKKRSVPIRTDLWASLQAHAPKRVSALVERICELWLQQAPDPPVKAEPKAEKIIEPASLDFQLAKYYKQQKAAKDAVGAGPSDGNEPSHAETQPETGKPKKCTCKIRFVWGICKGPNSHVAIRANAYESRQAAEAAVAKYFACHQWHPFISFCELCKAWHLYRDPVQRGEEEKQ